MFCKGYSTKPLFGDLYCERIFTKMSQNKCINYFQRSLLPNRRKLILVEEWIESLQNFTEKKY